MIGSLKTANFAWVSKIAVNGYNWAFVHESVHSYEEGMHVPQGSIRSYKIRTAFVPMKSEEVFS